MRAGKLLFDQGRLEKMQQKWGEIFQGFQDGEVWQLGRPGESAHDSRSNIGYITT